MNRHLTRETPSAKAGNQLQLSSTGAAMIVTSAISKAKPSRLPDDSNVYRASIKTVIFIQPHNT